MRIALADDDVDFLAQAARTLALLLDERGTQADVRPFTSAAGLLAARNDGGTFDMYLLDVVMPDMDGITLGRRIRADQPEAPLVYFTTSRDYALEAIGLEVADYVVKPFAREAFARALDRAFRRLSAVRPPSMTLKAKSGYANVVLRDIIAIEAGGRYQVVQTIDGRSFILQLSMQDLWDRLSDDSRFLRVGRRCIVNLAHLKDLRGGTMILVGGKRVSIPRRSLSEVKQAFLAFFGA